MKNKIPKIRTTLLRYWTTRYLITLLLGLFVLGAGSVWWIQETTLKHRLNLMEYMADETADRVVQSNGTIYFDPFFNQMVKDRSKLLQLEKAPIVVISTMDGELLQDRDHHRMRRGGPDDKKRLPFQKVPSSILKSDKKIVKLQLNDQDRAFVVKSPIVFDDEQAGWVFVIQDADDLKNVNQEYRLLFILLGGLGLLGWSIIYFLTRKISKPIQDVSRAAKLVADGNYEISLNTTANELEIHELILSFKEMADKLMTLEKLRAELLAGVTHDLKTPVTAISGLVQAVRDGVVEGADREEFLNITMKEVYRLQTMISDLLDFNSVSAGAITLRLEKINVSSVVSEIVHDWVKTQENDFEYEVLCEESVLYREIDPLRLQQILINLLNNAYQALGNGPRKLLIEVDECGISVSDTGIGIPLSEQPYVFERFFRGEKKKLKVRGLGLGLPFSKILAKALGADLILVRSSEAGTTFRIVWNS